MAFPTDAITRYLMELKKKDPNAKLEWGRLGSLSPNVQNVESALARQTKLSSRRPSSGETSNIQRKGGRKARKEHYTRKAILEKRKEAERRAAWEMRHPGASESNWQSREERRKTRKAADRLLRKTMKKRGSSNK